MNQNSISSAKQNHFWIWILAIALLKLWLVSAQNLWAVADGAYDGALFVGQGSSIAAGHWLGDFNNRTLIKGVFYPIWIALSFYAGLPLLISQHLVYLGSGIFLVKVLRKQKVNAFFLIFLFSVFAFNPSTYNWGSLRAVRGYLYSTEVVIVFTIVLATFVALQSRHRAEKWFCILGISLVPFWLTREEGIWILPSYLLANIFFLYFSKKKEFPMRRAKRFALLLIPAVILFSSLSVVKFINFQKYGVWISTEFQADYFKAAYGSILRVKHENWRRYIQVPREVRRKIYTASPAFAELKPHLEGETLAGWTQYGCYLIDPCDDYSTHFVWAFRDAVSGAGYYANASTAKKFYARLASEVNSACDECKLDCSRQRASMAPVFRREYIWPTIAKLVEATKFVLFTQDFSPTPPFARRGTREQLEFFEKVTHHHNLVPPPRMTLKGWAFSTDGRISVAVKSKSDSTIKDVATLENSPDLYKDFSNSLSGNLETARKARFELETTCTHNCEFIIRKDGEVKVVIDIDKISDWGKAAAKAAADNIYFNLDYAGDPSGLARKPRELKLKVLGLIHRAYQVTMPVLFIISLVCFGYTVARGIRVGYSVFTALNSVLLIAIFSRLLLVSYVDATSFSAINTQYLMPAFPLLLSFVGLSLYEVCSLVWDAKGSSNFFFRGVV